MQNYMLCSQITQLTFPDYTIISFGEKSFTISDSQLIFVKLYTNLSINLQICSKTRQNPK